MAKKQSRRSVSLNRSNYESAKQEAARRGMPLSALVESALAAVGVPMVVHPKQAPALVQASAERRTASTAREPAPPPPRRPSRERQVLGDLTADAYGFQ